MTLVDKVREEIINNTQDIAEKIIKEAKAEEKNILKQVDDSLKEKKKIINAGIEEYRKKNNALLDTEIDSLVKRKKLEIESRIINEVFELSMKRLSNLSESKRKKHIKSIPRLSKEFPIIYCSEKDKKLVKDSKIIDINGGLVLESKNGMERIDLSYGSILYEIKKENLSEIFNFLFENDI